MAKVLDITDKLTFEANPVLKIGDVELEVNSDATAILQLMQMVSEEENNPAAVSKFCNTIFTKESVKKIEKMHLKFADFQTVVYAAMDLATDTGGEDSDAAIQAMI